jgi:SAM-dependent methyltransferase
MNTLRRALSFFKRPMLGGKREDRAIRDGEVVTACQAAQRDDTEPNVYSKGLYPVCPATHDLGIRRLFDLSTLLLLLDCRPGDTVLDVGAGPGFASEMLARLGYDVVALDVDRRFLAHNRERLSHDRARIAGTIRPVTASTERMPFPDATFDGVLGMPECRFRAAEGPGAGRLLAHLRPGQRAHLLVLRSRS